MISHHFLAHSASFALPRAATIKSYTMRAFRRNDIEKILAKIKWPSAQNALASRAAVAARLFVKKFGAVADCVAREIRVWG